MSKSSYSLISFRFKEGKCLLSGFNSPLFGGIIATNDNVCQGILFGGVKGISRRHEARGRSVDKLTLLSSSPQITLKSILFKNSLSGNEKSEPSDELFKKVIPANYPFVVIYAG